MVLLVSYGVSQLVSFGFFPNNSPKINTERALYLVQEIQKQPQRLIAMFNKKADQKVAPFPKDVSTFQMISKGVYAKEEGTQNITVIKLGEVDMVQYSFVVDGKPITVTVPVGSISKETLEKQMNEMKDIKSIN